MEFMVGFILLWLVAVAAGYRRQVRDREDAKDIAQHSVTVEVD